MNTTLKLSLKTFITKIKSSSHRARKAIKSLIHLKKKSSHMIHSTTNATINKPVVAVTCKCDKSPAAIHSNILMTQLRNKLESMIKESQHPETKVEAEMKAVPAGTEAEVIRDEIIFKKIEHFNNLNSGSNSSVLKVSTVNANDVMLLRKRIFFYPRQPALYRIPMKIYFNLSWVIQQVRAIQRIRMDFVDYRHYLLTTF